MQTHSNNNYRNELPDDQIAHQCNLIHIVERYGYTPDEDIRELAKGLLRGTVPLTHPIHMALTKHIQVRTVFMKHFERTLKPHLFGINRKWRKTQEELVRATLKSFDRGYVRLLSEVPTGSGKSMYIGALVRAALDTIKELGLDEEIHIFTSRIAIAGQLIYEELTEEETEDRPLDLGKKGDVRIWCPELNDDQIRLLAGKNGQRKEEREKDSLLTVSTYQGLSVRRVTDCFKKPAFITICDESHRVTERVALIIEQMKSLVSGMSATVIGPDRDPFFFFEKIERPEIMATKEKKTYIDYLNYHKSIAEMIKDKELKSVRWINARRIRIDVSDAQLRSSGKSVYDVFNDASVSKILSKYPELGAEVIAEAYLGDHEGLILSGSKPIYQRRGIAYVDRILTAKECALACNNTLPSKLKEKYGEDAYFKAGYVDGTMSETEYNSIINEFRMGKITLLFSAEKIGEGVDLPFVNLVIPLRVLGFGSQWKLVQNLGRGIRVDPNDPFGDLVVLDLVFVSDKHLLASVLGIFGRSSILSGGLLAGWGANYELEAKVFELLKKCRTWTELWAKLTDEERESFPFIRQKVEQEKRHTHEHQNGTHFHHGKEHIFTLSSIQFIEQEDVRLALSLGNHVEMVKYAIELLIDAGYTSVDHLQSIRDQSLALFAKRRFDRFRDGLTMVNLTLQENKPVLTSTNMTSFIEVLRKGGLPERRSNRAMGDFLEDKKIQSKESPTVFFRKESPDKGTTQMRSRNASTTKQPEQRPQVPLEQAIEQLVTKMRDLFGIEPEFSTNFRDLHGRPSLYTGQATIALPEGHRFNSTIHKDVQEEKVKQKAAAELDRIIAEEFKRSNILIYRGSEWYANHIKVIQLIIHEYKYSKPFYTITERNGVFVVQATMEKHKMKISGNPVVHPDRAIAKQHAEVMLARALMTNLPSCRNSPSPKVSRKYIENLEKLCDELTIKYNGFTKKVPMEGCVIYESTLSALDCSVIGCGITPEHAKEKAAAELYQQLLEYTKPTRNN